MKRFKIIALCVFLMGISSSANAQLWKKLKKKLEKKVSQKVEDKIDKETDKTIDDVLNGKPKKKEPQIKQSVELPKFVGGQAVLKFSKNGYEYITEDIAISVYGSFTTENISKSVKTYNESKIIAPVDAYPEGYALAYNASGFLNTKNGEITIHHADAKKIVFSLKGTWNTTEGNKPISASFVNLQVSEVFDKRENNTSTENNPISDLPIFDNKEDNLDPKIPDTFLFTSSLEVQITSNGKNSAKMEFLIGQYSTTYGMAITSPDMGETNKIYNVITPETITIFMEVGGMKIKKSASEKQYSKADFSDKAPTNPADLKKTGATKSILGYTCYEYKYTNQADYTSIWVTKEFPIKETYINMLGMSKNNDLEGFVLEMDIKSGKDTANMKAVKFNEKKKITINPNEYKSLGF